MLKKSILVLTVILFSVQSEASLRRTWLETKAGVASEEVMMADQAGSVKFENRKTTFIPDTDDPSKT